VNTYLDHAVGHTERDDLGDSEDPMLAPGHLLDGAIQCVGRHVTQHGEGV
jgi:hypothetical protein